ncbi:MAG: helix-turn-helix transcriptional regulator [Rhodospirillales bacterium]|jgi:DNA-binding HxlR family transcriptional regulator|nr:helix-turn-helix transcriptional regulator [Rhodospirillales bacterium]MBT4040465.1 helix-turn-helix transcriptional regulator [Rhodospirillales bacterium]MBT4627040.1 helix-turn-helix transcriptional regulator [Rhodospirillales bacterium]MBT5350765.1 helix-turn-helix transcriptional regulator [Rhodospirillales bacterium]MBT5521394.1 helix-turn-helix transcriptional regulator [Rhodospirillales bacterium]
MTKRETAYGQFCPIAMTSEILAVKWVPLIIRELLCGSYRFGDLQKGVPKMSPSLLSARLKDLEFSGVVRTEPTPSGRGYEYFLTEAGEEMRPLIMMFGNWSEKWLTHEIPDGDLDPSLLMWDIRRRVVSNAAPTSGRFIVEFQFSGTAPKHQRWWIVFESDEADLCVRNPGYDIDLTVSSSLRVLVEIWMGRRSLKASIRNGDLVLDGSRKDCAYFPKWFSLGVFADKAVA